MLYYNCIYLYSQIICYFVGGECISYGARCLNEGGYHAIPKLTFPGGLLVGCSAGFLNAVKIKGTHTAMKSGLVAAETIFNYLTKDSTTTSSSSNDSTNDSNSATTTETSSNGEIKGTNGVELKDYETNIHNSWIMDELKVVRNSHASFKYGLIPGLLHTALSCFITKGKEPWTVHNNKSDSSRTLPADQCTPITYPKPDNKISFDLLTNLQRSGTNHDHDQPSHLKIKPNCTHMASDVSYLIYNGPEQRFCPAGVYEYTDDVDTTSTATTTTTTTTANTTASSSGKAHKQTAQGKKKLVINAQNCVHCKCCSIKTPDEYIKWTVPEGGGGPGYTVM